MFYYNHSSTTSKPSVSTSITQGSTLQTSTIESLPTEPADLTALFSNGSVSYPIFASFVNNNFNSMNVIEINYSSSLILGSSHYVVYTKYYKNESVTAGTPNSIQKSSTDAILPQTINLMSSLTLITSSSGYPTLPNDIAVNYVGQRTRNGYQCSLVYGYGISKGQGDAEGWTTNTSLTTCISNTYGLPLNVSIESNSLFGNSSGASSSYNYSETSISTDKI